MDPRTAPFVYREALAAFERELGSAPVAPPFSRASVSASPLYAWHQEGDRVWVVGPEEQTVRRNQGIIEHLHSCLYVYERTSWEQGRRTPVFSYNLQQDHVIDAKAILVAGSRIYVVGMGSSNLWSATWDGESLSQIHVRATGLGPNALALRDDQLEVTEAIEGAVSRWDPDSLTLLSRVYQNTEFHDSWRQYGEILFYTEGLWQLPVGEGYTCNTCHPDGGTDHRRHPGYHESRWEITRPLWGIAQVQPLFSNMSAKTLGDAVEGLIRSLDERFWNPGEDASEFWLEPKTIRVQHDGKVTLSPIDVRKSILAFLYSLNIERPAVSITDEGAFRAGAELFLRDCADCHRPRAATPLELADLVEIVTGKQGGMFYAPLFAKTGVEPTFTSYGNRVSPLVGLARGGPFMSNGQFPTLADVLVEFSTEPGHQHAGGRRGIYSPGEVKDLQAFLLHL